MVVVVVVVVVVVEEEAVVVEEEAVVVAVAARHLAQQRVRRPDEPLRVVGTALSERGARGGLAVARTSSPL